MHSATQKSCTCSSGIDASSILQAESVREAAWGCEWVGAPVPFVRCLSFVIATANKELMLTAGKFVPVSKITMMNVRYYFTLFRTLRGTY
jgi:hypothetical protein